MKNVYTTRPWLRGACTPAWKIIKLLLYKVGGGKYRTNAIKEVLLKLTGVLVSVGEEVAFELILKDG